MDQKVLAKACDTLGWKYSIQGDILMVTDAGQKENLHGEFVLVVQGNYVSFNRFYLREGAEKVEQLRETFNLLNVEYAENAVRKAFEEEGFTVENDSLQDAFTPVGSTVDRPAPRRGGRFLIHDQLKGKVIRNLIATGVTRIPDETEPVAVIRFSILEDGTVISDSNYIPRDVHDYADHAMLNLDRVFGTKRREGREIRRKRIPAEYRDKAYCSPKNKSLAMQVEKVF